MPCRQDFCITPSSLWQNEVKVREQKKTVIWFIWFVLFVWLNETNQMNQINQINKTNQTDQMNQINPFRLSRGPHAFGVAPG